MRWPFLTNGRPSDADNLPGTGRSADPPPVRRWATAARGVAAMAAPASPVRIGTTGRLGGAGLAVRRQRRGCRRRVSGLPGAAGRRAAVCHAHQVANSDAGRRTGPSANSGIAGRCGGGCRANVGTEYGAQNGCRQRPYAISYPYAHTVAGSATDVISYARAGGCADRRPDGTRGSHRQYPGRSSVS